MKILVCGDSIFDQYSFGVGKRLCPEACAPVIHIEREATTAGGAALVFEQLKALMGAESVESSYGSVSHKHRIFAGNTLLCRVDRDSFSTVDSNTYWRLIQQRISGVNAVVVGDYGKGAMPAALARQLTTFCEEANILLFVDAKADPTPYKDCFAIFPNEEEHKYLKPTDYGHIIRKMGAKGCIVDGASFSTTSRQVFDVTGAGDIFLAAFVSKFMQSSGENKLAEAATFANLVAGISVQHLGTYVVQADEVGALRASSSSAR